MSIGSDDMMHSLAQLTLREVRRSERPLMRAVSRSIELDEVEGRERASGELDQTRADRQRTEIDAEETETVDQRPEVGFGSRVVAGIEQHPPAALASGIFHQQPRQEMVEGLDHP